MRGRAGRKGKDEIGESYVCCTNEDVDEVEQLLETELPAVTSCLTSEKRGIKRALLEVIAIRLAGRLRGIQDYASKTLLFHSVDSATLQQMLNRGLDELREEKLIQLDDDDEYNATPLGKAIVAAGLELDSGIFIYDEIQHALQHFVMVSLRIFHLKYY